MLEISNRNLITILNRLIFNITLNLALIRLTYILITLRERRLLLLLNSKSTSLRILISIKFIENSATLRLRLS